MSAQAQRAQPDKSPKVYANPGGFAAYRRKEHGRRQTNDRWRNPEGGARGVSAQNSDLYDQRPLVDNKRLRQCS